MNYEDSDSSDYYIPTSMTIIDSSSDEDDDMPKNVPDRGNLKFNYNMNNNL
jgi:hypothetical protein